MSVSRYIFSQTIRKGTTITVANTYRICKAVEQGLIPYRTTVLEQGQRLDHVAGIAYGDSSLWWIIAAASAIGWGSQAPPGTIIRIPLDPNEAIGMTA